jgi:hypothetical protein
MMCEFKHDPQLFFSFIVDDVDVSRARMRCSACHAPCWSVIFSFLIGFKSAILMSFIAIVLHCTAAHTVRYFNGARSLRWVLRY